MGQWTKCLSVFERAGHLCAKASVFWIVGLGLSLASPHEGKLGFKRLVVKCRIPHHTFHRDVFALGVPTCYSGEIWYGYRHYVNLKCGSARKSIPASVGKVGIAHLWRESILSDTNTCRHQESLGGSLATILYKHRELEVIAVFEPVHVFHMNIGARLVPGYLSGNGDGILSGTVGLTGQDKRPNEQNGANSHNYKGEPSSPLRAMRRSIHTLLGDKIILLPLLSLFFAALTGIGCFIVFDDLNRQWRRQFIGRLLLFSCPVAGAVCLLLGLQ